MVFDRNYEKTYRQIVMVLSFLCSFVSTYTLIPWLLLITIILTWTDGVRGALRALILIQARSLLSTAVAVDIVHASIIKWICLFFLSFYIIIKCSSKIDKKVYQLILLLLLFLAYLIVATLFVSSYPIVSITKAISFVVPFSAIIMGVSTVENFDCIEYLTKILGVILFSGIVLIFSSRGYLVSQNSFQSILNHPNIFGIMLAVFLAGYLYIHEGKPRLFDLFVIACVFVLIFMSSSRTALISATVVVATHFMFSNIRWLYKVLILLFSLILLILALELPMFNFLNDFIYKGHDDLLYSREDLINENLNRFYENPFIGTGFNVPYVEGVRSFEFSFDLIVENGNFATALLGDIGIIGILIFFLCYYYIFACGNKRYAVLFIAPFIVSMGEMVFFSTNGCAIVLYFYFAAYLNNPINITNNCTNLTLNNRY